MAGGKELYIGEMLEDLQGSMAEMVAAVAKLETSNATVVEELGKVKDEIIGVAMNTSQSIASVKIVAGEQFAIPLVPEEVILTSTTAPGGSYNSAGVLVGINSVPATSSRAMTVTLDKFKSFADGTAKIKILESFGLSWYYPKSWTAVSGQGYYAVIDSSGTEVAASAKTTHAIPRETATRINFDMPEFEFPVVNGETYTLVFMLVVINNTSSASGMSIASYDSFKANCASLYYSLTDIINDGAFVMV